MDRLAYAESIIATVREPLVVLDAQLKVISANRAFYQTFKVTPQETIGQGIYDVGNRQWDIPQLRKLLEEIIPKSTEFNDYEVVHDFKNIGPKVMLLNARKIYTKENHIQKILLAIEDVTEHAKIENIREEFMGLVSHELRSPITSLLLGIGNLREGILGPFSKEQAVMLDVCQSNAAQLAGTIDNILTLSRLRHEQKPIEQKETNLCALIHNVIQKFQENTADWGGVPSKRNSIPHSPVSQPIQT